MKLWPKLTKIIREGDLNLNPIFISCSFISEPLLANQFHCVAVLKGSIFLQHQAHKLILDEEERGKVNTIVSVSESWSLCPGAEIGQIEIFVNKQQQQLQELNIGVDCQNNDDWSYLVFTEHIIVWFVVSWCCWRVLFVESIMVGSSSPGCILELVSSSWQWYCSGHDHSRLWFVV